VVNIRNMSAISSGDAVLAAPMTNNFSQVVLALNSSAMNSDNYGQSSIKSQNVQSNAILAQHLSAHGFPVQKFSSACLVHDNFNFNRTDKGVQLAIAGMVASLMPANGVRLGVYTWTQAQIATGEFSITVNWSNAIHGNPSFTTTPYFVGQPVFQAHSTSGTGPKGIGYINPKSNSCILACYAQASSQTYTVTFMAIGAV